MSSTARYYTASVVLFAVALLIGLLQANLSVRLAISVLALHFAWRACTVSEGSTHPIGLYLALSGLYVFAAFSEVALFGNRQNLDPGLMGDLADMGVGFLLFAATGYLLCRRDGPVRANFSEVDLTMVKSSIYVCLILLIISTSLIIFVYGTSIGSISRADLYSNDSSLLTVIRGVLATSFGISAVLIIGYERRTNDRLSAGRRLLLLSLILYSLVDLLILGDRRLPLMAIIGVGSVMLPSRFTWRQISIVTVLATVLFFYGFVRNTPPNEWIGTISSGDILLAFSPASTEFGGLAVIGQAIGDFDHALAGFPTYADGLLQLIPRVLYESRPLSPTEWFIKNYFPELAASGASYAFNQVIEARMNFGLFGIAVIGLITGAAIALLVRIQYRGAAIGIPLCANVFCFSMRMDMVSIVRTGVISAIGTVTVLVIAETAARLSRPRQSFAAGQPL